MPALTPTRDLDLLDHIRRVPIGGARRAGWTVTIQTDGRDLERHFPDQKDGVAALRRAVDWRDDVVKRVNRQTGRVAAEGAQLGVRLTTRDSYEVVVATLPADGDRKRQRTVLAVDKHGYEGAIRKACQFRFDGMRERVGSDYPFSTVDELIAAVHTAESMPA